MNRFSFMKVHRLRDMEKAYDCHLFELGIRTKSSECETDGHYMCDYCKHNIHQKKEYARLGIKTGLLT